VAACAGGRRRDGPRQAIAILERHDGDMREWIAAEPQGFRGAGRIADVRLPARLQEQGAWLALDGSPTSCRVPMSASRNSSHETSDGWFAAFSDSNRVIVVLGRMLTAQSGPPTALSSCQRRRQIARGQLCPREPGACYGIVASGTGVPVDHRHVGPFPLVRSDLGEAAYRRSLAVVMDNIVHRRRPGNSSIRVSATLTCRLWWLCRWT
jgi:hypothetical protein